MHLIDEPKPTFPPSAIAGAQAQIGAVVLRVHLDASGNIIDKRVAASVPPGVFENAVQQVAPQWHVVRDPSSAANCVVAPLLFESVQFLIK